MHSTTIGSRLLAPRVTLAVALAGALLGCGDSAPSGPIAPSVRFAACVATDAYSPTSGWRATCPNAAGVDSELLRGAFVEAPRQLPSILSLIVVRHGYLVGENYYNESRATSAFEMRSVTKGVTSALVGVAMQQGLVDSTGQRVSDVMPNYFANTTDPRKLAITLRDLLSMEAGWSPETPLPSVTPYVAALIGRPLANPPGVLWNYDDGSYHILSATVDRAVGGNLLGFAQERFFIPLGIGLPDWNWYIDDIGIPFGSGGLALTARDAAKIGELYLRDGVWDGQRVLAAGWVDSTFVPRAVGSGDAPTSYGYGWWSFTENGYVVHYALGFGGQFIAVVPDLDLVVILTANPYTPDSAPVDHFRTLLHDQLLPAVLPD